MLKIIVVYFGASDSGSMAILQRCLTEKKKRADGFLSKKKGKEIDPTKNVLEYFFDSQDSKYS
ncbi:hypothetical protein DERF_004855 [Dermatophagoides farinae]|uniref:Uncharacterized protein n=1 Tax=Dermatophagoides farinae TaxID=6954 RepID=A0A922I2B5_DERFA|nr:hypothetical protein DERF_004855 [Dermatophagoides farinae]